MQDLYRQFAELESKGKLKARGHGEAEVDLCSGRTSQRA